MVAGDGALSVVGSPAGGSITGAGAFVGRPGAVAVNGANVSGDGLLGSITSPLGDAVGDGLMGSGTSIGRRAGDGNGATVFPTNDGVANAGEDVAVGEVGAGRKDGKSNTLGPPPVGGLFVGAGTTTRLAKGAGVMGGSVCRVILSSMVTSTTRFVLRL